MSRSLARQSITVVSLFLVGCQARQPSTNIFEAINRKDFRESEVRDMIASDPSLASALDDSGCPPLYWLATRGRVSLIEFVLDQGADVNQPGFEGISPLGAACHEGEIESAKLLLERGADPNLADDNGETPLHQIILWCPEKIELFQLIVDSGAALDVVTNDGRTLLEFCRDRRRDYADPGYAGSDELQERFLDAYDELEAYIQIASP